MKKASVSSVGNNMIALGGVVGSGRRRGAIGTVIVDSATVGANAPICVALRGDSTLVTPAAAAEHRSEERRVPPVVQRALVPAAQGACAVGRLGKKVPPPHRHRRARVRLRLRLRLRLCFCSCGGAGGQSGACR